jgi:ABC-type phosphate transport system ATPase subunit
MQRRLLLLDEPTASADLKGIDLLEEALLNYCAENECAVVFATHSPAQAIRVADEVIFLHQGVIVEQGEANLILSEPQREETRDFLNHWKI